MVNASLISRLSHAVDEIEKRSQQNRPWKVVTVRRGYHEDGNVAQARHFAAHPEDRGANVVIFRFCDDEEMSEESQDCAPSTGPAHKEP
jgi:cobalamin biosynthesis Mg chelatase CobN